jgi:hypothetical protein
MVKLINIVLSLVTGALAKQAAWDIELATATDGDGETSWHLMLDMTAPGWTLEKRVRKYVSSAGDSVSQCKVGSFV